ncbi:MAG TPA: outer membrane protein [Xanthobacteraceae bacterium]|nr:outer membrane protein [Xanthobacteraceae bacterium]
MKKLLLAAGVAFALLSAPLRAADYPLKAPPALFNWTGFYVGANGGGLWGTTDQPEPDVFMNIRGSMAGGTAGYNWQAGNWVLGVEGDFDWAHMQATQFVTCGSGCTTKFDEFGSARARLGYANGMYLLYATGGAAFTRARIFSGSGVINGPWDTTTGWTVGGGLEGALSRNWSWKIEYLFARFDHFADAPAAIPTFASQNKFDIVRAGVNYRFGSW